MRGDRGAATLLLVAFLCAALMATSVAMVVVRFAVARAEVSAAADLAALAGAEVGDCGRAATTAQANAAMLLACDLQGADVQVTVGRDLRLLPGRVVRLSAEARAGPA